ncbi:hypothetical protein HDU96_007333 [Phlyctochytrium bullatum]|nr:hypothetical protein HDU96_007333 [Phlyctochytrium bullatum]
MHLQQRLAELASSLACSERLHRIHRELLKAYTARLCVDPILAPRRPALVLHGSAATGLSLPSSDLDVKLLLDPPSAGDPAPSPAAAPNSPTVSLFAQSPKGWTPSVLRSAVAAHADQETLHHAATVLVPLTHPPRFIGVAKAPHVRLVDAHTSIPVDLGLEVRVDGGWMSARDAAVKAFLDRRSGLADVVRVIRSLLRHNCLDDAGRGGIGCYALVLCLNAVAEPRILEQQPSPGFDVPLLARLLDALASVDATRHELWPAPPYLRPRRHLTPQLWVSDPTDLTHNVTARVTRWEAVRSVCGNASGVLERATGVQDEDQVRHIVEEVFGPSDACREAMERLCD